MFGLVVNSTVMRRFYMYTIMDKAGSMPDLSIQAILLLVSDTIQYSYMNNGLPYYQDYPVRFDW
mgnify:CR=1 FL=1